MNKYNIILKLLPGFLPLFVFIIADEIWGTIIGLYVAVGFGLLEFIYTYLKDKRIDKFILFDTLLLVLLGGISIILDNDIFFKLKPALIELIFCGILGISAFSSQNIILGMSSRYMKGMTIDKYQEKIIVKSMRGMFVVFLVHTLLIIYSAYFMSKESWAFISGGLFYIIAGGYFLFEFLKNKLRFKILKNEEWLPLVDSEGLIIGKAPRSECHKNPDFLHPVVHMQVLNNRGQIFLQKRPMSKLVQPGKWDSAVGGHISFGETLENALIREAKEEIGLNNFKPVLLKRYLWKTEIESELVYMFMVFHNGHLLSKNEEIDEGKFWKFKEIKDNLDKNIFTPNFEHEFKILIEKRVI